MDKYRVSLTAVERAALEQLVSVGKAAARKLTHARILLLGDAAAGADSSDEEIVATLSVGSRTIARVRQRFVTEGFLAALDHRPQPPRPDKIKIKGDIEQELVRLACSDPPPAAATGLCSYWRMNWSSWDWSNRSVRRPSDRL